MSNPDKQKAAEFLREEASIIPADEAPRCDIEGDPALAVAIIKALSAIFDPEIPVNIYELGLIYKISIAEDATVKVDMTLTAPGCPVAHTFPGQVEAAVAEVEGVKNAEVTLVWEPTWTMARMSDAAKLELGMF